MSSDQLTIFLILGLALVLFAWGRFRHDMVAAIALVAVVVTGLVDPADAFSGFGHPAVVTVASVLVISQALNNSGVVDLVAEKLLPYTAQPIVHIAALTAVVTVASAFMNNVGALALMLPVALATAAEHKRSPAMLLMPLAFGSILGGMTTLIGTPPNIIIATYREELGQPAFSMFDFSGVGLPVALLGVIFVAVIGWRLIPKERLSRNAPQQLFEIEGYITEIKVAKDSPLVGELLQDVAVFSSNEIDVIGLARGHGRAEPIAPGHVLAGDDILILRADPAGLDPVLETEGLDLVTSATKAFERLNQDNLTLVEGVIAPGSPLEGRDVAYLRRRTQRSVALVALARQGKTVRKRLRRQIFKAGDILLLEGSVETMDEVFNNLTLLPLARRDLRLGKPQRVGAAVLIFAVAIGLGVAGLVPLTVAFIGAILVYIVTNILPLRDVYKNIDWPVIVLLGGMIPVGRALESTGSTELVAQSIVSLTGGVPVWAVLTLILVVTMFLSDIINNAATALVMAPISVGVANSLGVNIDPFLMAVAVGASCAFLTPIGHQSNTLVMGPGGYQFTDYWRMGLPLEVLIVLLGVPMILLVWPL
ncbi:MAG: SLC13 family permease [Gammaproteobacteria bacterium]|nr:SLC13 family permease [Gammaproteobacteria bacterium]MDH3464624.1 SLC13 family permease [Gammaproteobacteria bacterium]